MSTSDLFEFRSYYKYGFSYQRVEDCKEVYILNGDLCNAGDIYTMTLARIMTRDQLESEGFIRRDWQ